MPKSAKIAFSLDEELLKRVEKMRARTGESRSAVIARALVLVTTESSRDERLHRYVQAYREHPETPEEQGRARTTARSTLRRLP